ncbi:MAG: flagellar biosynthesis protein FlhA [Proteobacteria bacterium]|nr:flagellar biosynthesis protein FlhA [Pseudomonadota bacterium]
MTNTLPTTQNTSAAAVPAGMPAMVDFNHLFRRPDVWLAGGLICILMMMILPIPPFMVDMGLTLSLTFSVVILMTVLFIRKPLDLSSFPTILLIATLLRLALNLGTTRLILSHGNEGSSAAGHVVEAFAGFIMSGSFVIGMIVFAILTIVNFVVITKGSTRIAEVAARFTLDAMPGKQMAIDADLSSGLIDEAEARRRRKELENESNFFGSMDGASKFVRGDAVAGLIIIFVNIIGGTIIGMAMHGMSFMQAADTYIRLTIGDGLATQVPALIVSVGAGFLVSKTHTGDGQTSIFGQMGGYPAALGMTSFLLGAMSLMPGIPKIPFWILAGFVGYFAWKMPQVHRQIAERKAAESAQPPVAISEEPIGRSLTIDIIRIELGYGLLSLVNTEAGQRLTDQIKGLRRQLAGEMGFVLPAVRIQDNLQLAPNCYVIRVKEIEAGRGTLRPGMLLVMDPRGETIALPGEPTTEPAFGLPAVWADASYREEALFKGYTVVDTPTVITTHLTEVVKDNMPEMLSYAEAQKLLDELDKEHQKLISDVIPSQITVGGLQRVLQNLLAERISIRDLPTILEGISEAAAVTRNITAITEHVRTRMARQISEAHTRDTGFIPLITLSPEWEQAFAESIIGEGDDKQLAMSPSKLQQFINLVRQTFDRHAMMGEAPVLLTSPGIRPYVRSIIERFRAATTVLSQNEIHPRARIKTLGQI